MSPLQLTFLVTMVSTKLDVAPPDKGITIEVFDNHLSVADEAFINRCGYGIEHRGAFVRVTATLPTPFRSLTAAKSAITNVKGRPESCCIVTNYFVYRLNHYPPHE